uniref:Uncharacterized protein n=1 Tax=viral metagenome TaxID=1070528 RepID=A0A6M3Y2A6_9ZZZZ
MGLYAWFLVVPLGLVCIYALWWACWLHPMKIAKLNEQYFNATKTCPYCGGKGRVPLEVKDGTEGI